ncbi:DUF3667 domain-containing protein [Dyadobacter psychrotolerans]|uniref:DUF3667 domain-containing protein n=1 Tax=Dyadobacter psychrotolerans TaxID=2541721 RepID=A0A4R5DBT4_9BACT|nr:DUF3667 domain-containing protein [Dyadobacter psychrotolerans]TDE09034.1 DUF3667 domain-containing protein [Dyadobacter psychrotolerans]
MNCKNCNAEVNSKFCPDCGQPVSLKRINGHYIVHEIEHVLHFERGILYTVKELVTNPGENIQKYLSENRSRLVKPIIFIIITSLIYSISISFFHIEDQYVKFEGEEVRSTTPVKIFKWIQEHYGYANIIMGIFITFWLKLFFRKFRYNIFEILVSLCFIMGIGMLIFSFFSLLQGLTKMNLMNIGGLAGITYCSWAIGQFFGKDRIINYLKAFLAYILGMATFAFLAISLGIVIDFAMKH